MIDQRLFHTRIGIVCESDSILDAIEQMQQKKAEAVLVRSDLPESDPFTYLGVIEQAQIEKYVSETGDDSTVQSIPFQPIQIVSQKDILEGNIDPSKHLLLTDFKNQIIGFAHKEQVPEILLSNLKMLQSYFNTLLDSVNDAVTCVDQDGTVLYWNRVAEEVYDVNRTEIVGKRIGEFFAHGSIMLFKILDEGRPIRQVYHHPRPDKHVLINASPIYAEHRLVGAIATEQDISRIVKMNEELTDLRSDESFGGDWPADPFERIKGCSHTLIDAVETAKQISQLSIPVILAGEKGVGKRLFAEVIHTVQFSDTSDHPFLTLNIGMTPPSMLESELFGFQANAFGGESQAKPGKLELASNGTLLIDEAESLPQDIQLKLAEVIERGEMYRIGSQVPIPLRTRLLFLSTQPPDLLFAEGILREELYYQLNRVCIVIPPLRERAEDILELAQHFLQVYAMQYHKPIPILAPEVIAAFTTYEWPGNVRELRNTLERLVIFSEDESIAAEQLPASMRVMTIEQLEQDHKLQPSFPKSSAAFQNESVALQDVERHAIVSALRKTAGNKAAAAKELGISRGTLYAKLRQFQIDDE